MKRPARKRNRNKLEKETPRIEGQPDPGRISCPGLSVAGSVLETRRRTLVHVRMPKRRSSPCIHAESSHTGSTEPTGRSRRKKNRDNILLPNRDRLTASPLPRERAAEHLVARCNCKVRAMRLAEASEFIRTGDFPGKRAATGSRAEKCPDATLHASRATSAAPQRIPKKRPSVEPPGVRSAGYFEERAGNGWDGGWMSSARTSDSCAT